MLHKDKLIGFTVFKDGARKMGIADITLPDIEYMSETLKGSGIGGELDMINPGNISAMSTTFNWRTINEDVTEFAQPKAHSVECFGAVQTYDAGAGELKAYQVKLSMRVMPKKISLGKFDNNSTSDTSNEFSVVYMKLSIDGKTKIEVDPLNYIFVVDGTDFLAKSRNLLGLM
ncbi:MAG: phage major tail tube protein [Acidaminococcaceae bacterium]